MVKRVALLVEPFLMTVPGHLIGFLPYMKE